MAYGNPKGKKNVGKKNDTKDMKGLYRQHYKMAMGRQKQIEAEQGKRAKTT